MIPEAAGFDFFPLRDARWLERNDSSSVATAALAVWLLASLNSLGVVHFVIQVSTREGGLFGDTDEVTASGEEQANFDDSY